AGDEVGAAVPDARQVSGANERQILDAVERRPGEIDVRRTADGVDAAGIDDLVVRIIDKVGVVAAAAGHGVGAGAAVERVVAVGAGQRIVAAAAGQAVVAAVADDDVVERVAGARQIRGTRERQVLDGAEDGGGVGGQVVADRTLHRVGAAAGSLVD